MAAFERIGVVTRLPFPVACLLVFVMVVASGALMRASAQTPSPGAISPTITCDAARLRVEEFLALLSADAIVPPSELQPIWEAMPPGSPTDAATEAAIERTYRQMEECVNTGDFVRLLGFFSDAGLVREFGQMGPELIAELRDLAATPVPPLPVGSRVAFIGPWHVQEIADGRVLAAVVWFGSEADTCIEPLRVDILVFVQQDGQWLIDEWVEDVGTEEPIDVVGPPPATDMKTQLKVCAYPTPVRGFN